MRIMKTVGIGGVLSITIVLVTFVPFVYHIQRQIYHNSGLNVADMTETVSLDDMTTVTKQRSTTNMRPIESPRGDNLIHLAMVVCGNRKDEGMTMIKSVIIWSRKKIRIHIFTEVDLQKPIRDELASIPEKFNHKFDYVFHQLYFPEPKSLWKAFSGTCASQRLFFPYLLKEEAVIYVDTDTLFLRPIDDMWHMFTEFKQSQATAMAPNTLDLGGWYTVEAKHPFYGKAGLNSGVMLMNLTRMRDMRWMSKIMEYYSTYDTKLKWFDQDILNIIFHFHPEKLYELPCEWNYRSDFCENSGNLCKAAEHHGISIVHGNRRTFSRTTAPTFRVIYDTFHNVHLDAHVKNNLLIAIQKDLSTVYTKCSKLPKLFTKQIERQIRLT